MADKSAEGAARLSGIVQADLEADQQRNGQLLARPAATFGLGLHTQRRVQGRHPLPDCIIRRLPFLSLEHYTWKETFELSMRYLTPYVGARVST